MTRYQKYATPRGDFQWKRLLRSLTLFDGDQRSTADPGWNWDVDLRTTARKSVKRTQLSVSNFESKSLPSDGPQVLRDAAHHWNDLVSISRPWHPQIRRRHHREMWLHGLGGRYRTVYFPHPTIRTVPKNPNWRGVPTPPLPRSPQHLRKFNTQRGGVISS